MENTFQIPLNFLNTFYFQARKILFPVVVLKTVSAILCGGKLLIRKDEMVHIHYGLIVQLENTKYTTGL